MDKTEKNELMVKDIVELLKKYNLCDGTNIYYNNKMLACFRGNVELIEDVRVEENLEWCNPETITIEGVDSNFFYVNQFLVIDKEEKAEKAVDELYVIGDKYNGSFDFGTDKIMFFIEDNNISFEEWDSLEELERYHYPK